MKKFIALSTIAAAAILANIPASARLAVNNEVYLINAQTRITPQVRIITADPAIIEYVKRGGWKVIPAKDWRKVPSLDSQNRIAIACEITKGVGSGLRGPINFWTTTCGVDTPSYVHNTVSFQFTTTSSNAVDAISSAVRLSQTAKALRPSIPIFVSDQYWAQNGNRFNN